MQLYLYKNTTHHRFLPKQITTGSRWAGRKSAAYRVACFVTPKIQVRRTFAASDVSFNVIICYPAVVCLLLGYLPPQGALFRDALLTNKLSSHLVHSRCQKQSRHLSKNSVLSQYFIIIAYIIHHLHIPV